MAHGQTSVNVQLLVAKADNLVSENVFLESNALGALLILENVMLVYSVKVSGKAVSFCMYVDKNQSRLMAGNDKLCCIVLPHIRHVCALFCMVMSTPFYVFLLLFLQAS